MCNNFRQISKLMNFNEAIGNCLKKYFVFKRIASKSEIRYIFLTYALVRLINFNKLDDFLNKDQISKN